MSPIWIALLVLCGLAVAVVALRLALRGRGGRPIQMLLAGAIPLLTGLLMGFATLAVPLFPVTLVWAAIAAWLLVRHYKTTGRLGDIGLLASGFGLTWTSLIGRGVWADLTDPAVEASPETYGFFGVGLAILSAGIVVLALTRATRRNARRLAD